MPKNDAVYTKQKNTDEKIASLEDKIDWLIMLVEMDTIARIQASNEEAQNREIQAVRVSGTAIGAADVMEEAKKKGNKEEYAKANSAYMRAMQAMNLKDLEEAKQIYNEASFQANVFAFLSKNYSDAFGKISEKALPILQKKYPILARKPKIPKTEDVKPGENVTKPVDASKPKCDKCSEEALLSKDGKNSCRKHYPEIFGEAK